MRSADQRLVVSTQCPTCGAPLDFGEGANCVACQYCRSRLLVTGRGQVLAYTVAPRVDAPGAFGIARFAEPADAGPTRFSEPRLCFLPYYRFRAIELRWQRPEPAPRPLEIDRPDSSSDYRPAISIEQVLADLAPGPDDVEFRERHIEKNFLALEFPGIELYSLGSRATALKLSLFGRAAIEEQGTVVAPQMSPAAAIERGERLIDAHNVAHRVLVARQLSLVYFPLWFVRVDRPGRSTVTIVDAVSQSVVLRGASAECLERFHGGSGEERTLGFRPLKCPNCGWDLALRPDDVFFYCTTCFRAWKLAGEEMIEAAHIVAEATRPTARRPAQPPGEEHHLPLWSLRGAVGDDAPRRFVTPAFRCRRLKTLADLTASLSRRAPDFVESERRPRVAHGAYFDESDAAALALFAEIGEGTERFIEVEERSAARLRVDAADLVWAPFASDTYSYLDPFTGTAIPKNLVL